MSFFFFITVDPRGCCQCSDAVRDSGDSHGPGEDTECRRLDFFFRSLIARPRLRDSVVRCSGISEARADGHEEFESESESESKSESKSEREKKGGGSTIGSILQRAFRGSECADPFGNSIRAPVQLLIVVCSKLTYYILL